MRKEGDRHEKKDRGEQRSGNIFVNVARPEWWRWSMKLPSPVAFFTVQLSKRALQTCSYSIACAFGGNEPRECIPRTKWHAISWEASRSCSDFVKPFRIILWLSEFITNISSPCSYWQGFLRAIMQFNASYQIHTCSVDYLGHREFCNLSITGSLRVTPPKDTMQYYRPVRCVS